MTIVAILLGFAIGGLVLLYLTRQRFDPLQISAARFFADLPTANELSPQLRLQNLLLSPPFYLQLAVLLLLLSAVLYQRGCVATTPHTLGVWFLVDTSASMETQQAGTTRAEVAREKLSEALTQIDAARDQDTLCLRLSTFDMELNDLVKSAQNTAPIFAARENVVPRPLGTDLTELRTTLIEQQAECPITHLYIISDQPAPEWMLTQTTPLVIWQDVSEAVANVGFTTIEAAKNPLTGLVQTIYLEVARHGEVEQSTVRVTDPIGNILTEQNVSWNQANRKQVQFTPIAAGIYMAEVLEGDAYTHDDAVTLQVNDTERIRVDWQLEDEQWLDLLGWEIERTAPQLRVAPLNTPLDTVPTLLIGTSTPSTEPQPIAFFDDSSELLNDLNLDFAEQLGLGGIALPEGFRPILSTPSGVWLAQRDTPAAAYVPTLPTFPITNDAEAFTATMFFNALRWLLQGEPAQPLFTLTSPEKPEPSTTHLVLHVGEGNTSHSADTIALNQPSLTPVTIDQAEEPLWPRLLAAVAGVLFVERTLAAFGGRRWR